MFNYFLECIGMMMLFFGMCMDTEDVRLFVAQFLIIVFGIMLFHIGLYLENLKIERIKTDMRVEKIRRRGMENIHISEIRRTYLKNQPLPLREKLYNKKTAKNHEDDSFKSLLDSEMKKMESHDRPKQNDSNTR